MKLCRTELQIEIVRPDTASRLRDSAPRPV